MLSFFIRPQTLDFYRRVRRALLRGYFGRPHSFAERLSQYGRRVRFTRRLVFGAVIRRRCRGRGQRVGRYYQRLRNLLPRNFPYKRRRCPACVYRVFTFEKAHQKREFGLYSPFPFCVRGRALYGLGLLPLRVYSLRLRRRD